ncbi:flagellar hook-length control protein FliK [Pseudoroseicyclus tamaricis]|uniref:Flagellar hook-length control protein FliK n=1 Tax=Pseudoroseicyclus tamaricis TaxID=2705421 RepID=A0A6B2JXF0_9RHOB|nr:flagellar hook-length control protein FliK [Pseudoroseicyclus tamaricis]NDV02545.1 flagellar hook-length control protein FliK [Pseudoroseicyclus tamaricis]
MTFLLVQNGPSRPADAPEAPARNRGDSARAAESDTGSARDRAGEPRTDGGSKAEEAAGFSGIYDRTGRERAAEDKARGDREGERRPRETDVSPETLLPEALPKSAEGAVQPIARDGTSSQGKMEELPLVMAPTGAGEKGEVTLPAEADGAADRLGVGPRGTSALGTILTALASRESTDDSPRLLHAAAQASPDGQPAPPQPEAPATRLARADAIRAALSGQPDTAPAPAPAATPAPAGQLPGAQLAQPPIPGAASLSPEMAGAGASLRATPSEVIPATPAAAAAAIGMAASRSADSPSKAANASADGPGLSQLLQDGDAPREPRLSADPAARTAQETAAPTASARAAQTAAAPPPAVPASSSLPEPPLPLAPSGAEPAPAPFAAVDGGTGAPGSSHAATGPAAAPQATPAAARETLVQVSAALPQTPGERVEIRLSPEELGSLRMVLHSHEGSLVLQISADRQDTADLLRRHAADLAREMQELGYDEVALDFTTTGEEAGDSQAGGGEGTPTTAAPADPLPAPAAPPPTAAATGGLDLRL